MKIGQRVIHDEFGEGVIIHISFEDTFRTIYWVRFDQPNEELHSCLGLCEDFHGKSCLKNELKEC